MYFRKKREEMLYLGNGVEGREIEMEWNVLEL